MAKKMSESLQQLIDNAEGDYVVIPKQVFGYIVDYAKSEEQFHDDVQTFIDDVKKARADKADEG